MKRMIISLIDDCNVHTAAWLCPVGMEPPVKTASRNLPQSSLGNRPTVSNLVC